MLRLRPAGRPMLLAASLLHPIGFTLGLRPPPSTRSRSLQMISDLERMLIEQREVQDRFLRDLRECNKVQSDNIQTLVSLHDPRTDVPASASPSPPPPLLPYRVCVCVAPTLTETAACSARSTRI